MEAEAELERLYRELQETKDQLVQAGRMAALGQLASGAAHEILNPLNIVSLRIQLLGSKGSLTDDVKRSLDVIRVQITRLVRIVDGLQEFSRLKEGIEETVQVRDIVENVLQDSASRIEAEKVAVKKDILPNLPLLHIDVERVKKAFLHIIRNALDAMRTTERKELTVGARFLRVADNHDKVQITFSDTGFGLSGEIMQRIYDPFFTTKGPDMGTGLGLWIAYGTIMDHGGTIRAEKNEAGGATFIIELPVGVEKKGDLQRRFSIL